VRTENRLASDKWGELRRLHLWRMDVRSPSISLRAGSHRAFGSVRDEKGSGQPTAQNSEN